MQQPPVAMLQQADAAILIGDPALLALENREAIETTVGSCQWHDLAHEWHTRTQLPWVAAVWAVRPEALESTHITAAQLTADLKTSRDHGLTHIDDLVRESDSPHHHATRHHPPLPHPQHPLHPRRTLHPRHPPLPPIRSRSRNPTPPAQPKFPLINPTSNPKLY